MKTYFQDNPTLQRIILWSLVAAYTFILPSAIIIYRKLEALIGQSTTGKIPLVAVIVIGIAYLSYGYSKNQNFKHILYLIPCALIAFTIIKLEANPNKHIHIPEYVLMAWLLYAALSKDYQGAGLLVLVFICGSMLGVVDELEQGIHPKRFYGWTDMLINSSSTFIGVLTIHGLSSPSRQTWNWAGHLKSFKWILVFMLYGFVDTILMCVYLFQVQAAEMFWGVYPGWLLGSNVFYLVLSIIIAIRHRSSTEADSPSMAMRSELRTAKLWLSLPLTILAFIHLLLISVPLLGLYFR